MRNVMTLFIFGVLCLTFSSTCFATRDKEMCDTIRKFVRVQSKKVPLKIDKITKLIKISSNCKRKTMYTTKAFTVSESRLPANMRAIMQKHHTETNCKKTGLAGGFGWTAISYFFDKDSVQLFTLKTSPKDC